MVTRSCFSSEKESKRRFLFFREAVAVFTMVLLPSAQAAMITVTSINDEVNPGGVCTLRGAVGAINSSGVTPNDCMANDPNTYGTNDTIVFDASLAGQTIQFTAQISVSKPLTIKGPATAISDPTQRVTLQGGGEGSNFRLLSIANAASPLTVEDLNFIDGNLTGTGMAGAGAAIRGSGNGTITVKRCHFENNRASKYGGAIEGDEGNVNALDSEFFENRGTSGGAVGTYGSIVVAGSTFSGNEVTGDGGALWADGVIAVGNSTFIGNKAKVGGAIWVFEALIGRHLTLVNNNAEISGAAIYFNKEALLANSLIVGAAIGNNAYGLCKPFNSTVSHIVGQANLVANLSSGALTDDTSCGDTVSVSIGSVTMIEGIVNTTLGNHNGLTRTLALPAGSPAIGAADRIGGTSQMLDKAVFPAIDWVDATTDQVGNTRAAVAAGRSLGAYEGSVQADLILIPATLPSGAIDTAYGPAALSTDGGVAPYTYAVTEGSLPAGLRLNGDTIEGTPTEPGNHTFIVTATDNTGRQTATTYTITIGMRGAPVGATAIPLLGPWGLALLATLLGVVGWRREGT